MSEVIVIEIAYMQSDMSQCGLSPLLDYIRLVTIGSGHHITHHTHPSIPSHPSHPIHPIPSIPSRKRNKKKQSQPAKQGKKNPPFVYRTPTPPRKKHRSRHDTDRHPRTKITQK